MGNCPSALGSCTGNPFNEGEDNGRKKLVLAGVAGFVGMFAFGYIWHVPLLGEFYGQQTGPIALPEMAMPTIILAEIIRAFLLAYIYPLGYKGGSPGMEGHRFGVLMGLFTAMLPLVYVSQLNFASFNWFCVEGLFFVIQGAIAGLIVALIYGGQKA